MVICLIYIPIFALTYVRQILAGSAWVVTGIINDSAWCFIRGRVGDWGGYGAYNHDAAGIAASGFCAVIRVGALEILAKLIPSAA